MYGVIEKDIPYFLYQREEQKNIPAVLERGKFLSSRDTNSNNILPEEGKAKGVTQCFFTLGPENCGKPERVSAALLSDLDHKY